METLFQINAAECTQGLMLLPFFVSAILLYTNYKVNTFTNG